ncbi:MAG: hypothetical protein H7Y88_11185 [Phycisphaerales bacterium]|nr:hypothetical protein [Phycisphaerales bacterium]
MSGLNLVERVRRFAGAAGIVVGSAAGAAMLLASPSAMAQSAFHMYGQSYRTITMPQAGAGSSQLVGDVLPDGRIVAATGLELLVETGVGTGLFDVLATFDGMGVGGPALDPAFVRVSPDGLRLAIGGGFGKPVIVMGAGLLGTPGAPAFVTASNASFFDVGHYDAAWADDSRLALTVGDFGSPSRVTLLDVLSPVGLPSNRTIIDGIGGSSSGIAVSANGWVFTGNGFDLGAGGSSTGTIRAFAPDVWMNEAAPAAAFESEGVLIGEVLSAASLLFDAEGNLVVGGGDFGQGDVGYLGVVNWAAVVTALSGGGPIDVLDPEALRRLMPTGDGFSYYGSAFNPVTGELYATLGDFFTGANTWFATVPGPGGAGVMLVTAVFGARRGRRA